VAEHLQMMLALPPEDWVEIHNLKFLHDLYVFNHGKVSDEPSNRL